MADLTVPKGDYGFYLYFTVQDSTGTAFDLTDYTVTFKVWAQQVDPTPVVDHACTIIVAASGTCKYLVETGNFDVAGDYYWEIELTKTGAVESTRRYTLRVEESE